MSHDNAPKDVVGLSRLLIETLDDHAAAHSPRDKVRIWPTVMFYREKLKLALARCSPVATRA